MPNTEAIIRPKLNLQAPPMFKVIYINDNKTTVSFVVDSVVNYFNYAVSTAEKIAQTIHSEGSAVVAVLPFEIAEQKGIEVTVAARSEGFPLQIKIEKEEEDQ